MGGTLYVGELRTRPTPAERDDGPWWGWRIDEVDPVPEDAPAFPVLGCDDTAPLPWAREGNTRAMSYGAWSDFVAATGLGAVLGRVTMGEDARCLHLTAPRVERITALLDAYRAAHPEAVPRFHSLRRTLADARANRDGHPGAPESADPVADSHLARLVWLEWWARWALAHCRNPAIGAV